MKRHLKALAAAALLLALASCGTPDGGTLDGGSASATGAPSSTSSASSTPSSPAARAAPSSASTADTPRQDAQAPGNTAAAGRDQYGTDTGEGGNARTELAKLAVKGRGPKTGYSREQFGQTWADTDGDGCKTRFAMLNRDLKNIVHKPDTDGCEVISGDLQPDPYTATNIHFEVGGASEVDIDHVIALSNSWVSGAASKPGDDRAAFANDPLNLLSVDASANRQKGDGDAATWLPPNKPFRCAYIARQIAVKGKYGLSITGAEKEAMTRVLSGCPNQRVPSGGGPTTAPGFGPTTSAPAAASAEPAPSQTGDDVYYANCSEARAAGAAPMRRGEPGYRGGLDRDNDGVACE